MVKICRIIRIKLNQLVKEDVRIIAVLLRKWTNVRTTNISQSLPHGEKQLIWRNYVTVTLCVILLHMFPQYGELRPTSGWDQSGSLGHPCKFQRVSRLGSVTARHVQYWASAKLCGVEQRAPPIFCRAAITLGIGPHSSLHCGKAVTGA